MINLYSLRPKGFNIGNELIYYTMNHFLSKSFPEGYNIVSLSATKRFEVSNKAGFSASNVYEINQYGDGVIVGGGNLYENNMLDIDPVALKAMDKPLVLFSMSRGKIYNKHKTLVDRTDVMSDDKIRLINDKADFSLPRDVATSEYLTSIGCENTMGGCPTLFTDEAFSSESLSRAKSDSDAIISLRHPDLMSIPIAWQYKLREDIAEIINVLKGKGYKKIKFLCHDHRDIPATLAFDDIEFLYTEDIYTYLSLLKSTKLVVTFRLHSCMPCLALDIPVINISYDQRASSLLETVGIGDWDINMANDNIIQEINNRLNNLGDLENIIKENRKQHWPELKEIITNSFSHFANMVKN